MSVRFVVSGWCGRRGGVVHQVAQAVCTSGARQSRVEWGAELRRHAVEIGACTPLMVIMAVLAPALIIGRHLHLCPSPLSPTRWPERGYRIPYATGQERHRRRRDRRGRRGAGRYRHCCAETADGTVQMIRQVKTAKDAGENPPPYAGPRSPVVVAGGKVPRRAHASLIPAAPVREALTL
jgi:hypothetical protein